MKKILAVLMICALLLGAAYAESAVCRTESGDLYITVNGLTRIGADGASETVAEGEITRVFSHGDDVYFVKSETTAEGDVTDGVYMSEVVENTLYKRSADGTVTRIGEPAANYSVHEYNAPESFEYLAAYTAYNGLRELTVYGDSIYYIGNDGTSGSYTGVVSKDWQGEEAAYETAYESNAAVWRMDLDGSNPVMLIGGLGNGDAHMAIANDRIAVASVFRNPAYAYDFTNFMLYDLDGNLLKTVPYESEHRHSWIYTEDCEFTVIVTAITTDGEDIYASLGDSEGDFASTRFVNVNNIDETLALEAFYTPSKPVDDGLVSLGSDAEDTVWDDIMYSTLTLRMNGEILAYVPESMQDTENPVMAIDAADGTAYLCIGRENCIRVPLNGGGVEKWDGEAFVPAEDCTPEAYENRPEYVPPKNDYYLLEDSDTRIYTREELEDYSAETLAMMRNEILARHGYPFRKEVYREYFGNQAWYTEDPDYSEKTVNSVEWKNIETIKKLEAEK